MKKTIFCPECRKVNRIPFCGYQPYMNSSFVGKKCTYKDCDGILQEIDFPAEDCSLLYKISKDVNFIEAMIKLRQDDPIEYQLKLSQFSNQLLRQEEVAPQCPHCNSTNISPIGAGERAASIVALGIFSKKINKSFKCKSCGYTW